MKYFLKFRFYTIFLLAIFSLRFTYGSILNSISKSERWKPLILMTSEDWCIQDSVEVSKLLNSPEIENYINQPINDEGDTPLVMALRINTKKSLFEKLKLKIVKDLIKKGAIISKENLIKIYIDKNNNFTDFKTYCIYSRLPISLELDEQKLCNKFGLPLKVAIDFFTSEALEQPENETSNHTTSNSWKCPICFEKYSRDYNIKLDCKKCIYKHICIYCAERILLDKLKQACPFCKEPVDRLIVDQNMYQE